MNTALFDVSILQIVTIMLILMQYIIASLLNRRMNSEDTRRIRVEELINRELGVITSSMIDGVRQQSILNEQVELSSRLAGVSGKMDALEESLKNLSNKWNGRLRTEKKLEREEETVPDEVELPNDVQQHLALVNQEQTVPTPMARRGRQSKFNRG